MYIVTCLKKEKDVWRSNLFFSLVAKEQCFDWYFEPIII